MSEEISRLDLLHRWHPITFHHAGIHRAPESDPFFHKCLKKQSTCKGACFYTPVAMEVIGTPDFNYLDG